MATQRFPIRIGAVTRDMVQPQEPRILRVHHHQFAARTLQRRVAQSHVVRHGPQLAGPRQRQQPPLARDQIPSQQNLTVRLAMHWFEHLALPAPAGALVQDRHDIVIRGDDLDGRSVRRQPAFLLALVDQNAVGTLLGARAGVQVVRKDFMHIGLAVVNNHLPTLAIGMPEWRRDVEDRLGIEIQRHFPGRQHLLQVGQRAAEKRGVLRADQQRRVSELLSARVQRQQDQLLGRKPLEGLPAQGLEGDAEAVFELRFVRRLFVRDHHAVRVAAAHVRLGIVDRQTVPAPCNDRLDDAAPFGNLIRHFERIRRRIIAHGQLQQGFAVPRHAKTGAGGEQLLQFVG
jgi:hypothetical protein